MELLRKMLPAAISNLSQPCEAISSVLTKVIHPGQLLQLPVFFSPQLTSPRDGPISYTSSCPNAQLSCHNTSSVADTCCFNYPGGQFLQTQFWDTDPALGPKDSWTIHGLWPDHCDGGFDQFCDSGRKYSNISSILSSFDGTTDLVDYMKTYWLANRGSDESLWEHEWNKHGTCISTLDTKCYTLSGDSSSPPHRYILDYFNTTVSLFRTLDTYSSLAKAGISPSSTQRYNLVDLQTALQTAHGAPVTLRCRAGQFDEVWYHFDVLGSVQTGKFVPSAPDGPKSNCPSTGIKYLPKADPSNPSPTSTNVDVPAPTSTSEPFSGKGFLHVYVDGTQHGCLIRSGQWYTSGTCAGFTAKADIVDPGKEQLFTMSSRAALCSINEVNAFECSPTLPYQTIFSADGETLLFKNDSSFYAAKTPGRFEKVDIYGPGGVDDNKRGTVGDHVQVEIRWSGAS